MTDATRSQVLISAADLVALIGGAAPVVLLDIRSLKSGEIAAPSGHIPGAVYADLQSNFAGKQEGYSGRRPLPKIADFEANARRWGISRDSIVVVYDDNRGLQAGRAWWVLRWAGIKDVRLLDGGLQAWIAAGGDVSHAATKPTPGDIALDGEHLPVLDANAAAAFARNAILIDARSADAYAGTAKNAEDAVGGHIPGAHSAPTTANLTEAGTFADTAALRERFAKLGIDGSKPVGVYCGGGVAASHTIAALTSIGIAASLFPGSWSAWSSDPSRPVATGTQPG